MLRNSKLNADVCLGTHGTNTPAEVQQPQPHRANVLLCTSPSAATSMQVDHVWVQGDPLAGSSWYSIDVEDLALFHLAILWHGFAGSISSKTGFQPSSHLQNSAPRPQFCQLWLQNTFIRAYIRKMATAIQSGCGAGWLVLSNDIERHDTNSPTSSTSHSPWLCWQ